MCTVTLTLEIWPWSKDGSRSWHTFESWKIIVWPIIQVQHGSEELWAGHGLWACVHYDLGFHLRYSFASHCGATKAIYPYKVHMITKILFRSFHYAEIYWPNQNIQSIFVLPAAEWKLAIFFFFFFWGGGGGG